MPDSGTPSSRWYLISSFESPSELGCRIDEMRQLGPFSRSEIDSEIVYRLGLGLVADEDRRSRVAHKAESVFKYLLAAAKQPGFLSCLQIHAIEERSQGIRRGTIAGEIDGTAVF